MTLRLLIDSADPRAWRDLWPMGLFTGITTNPTLLRRAGHPCTADALRPLITEAFSLGCRELHLQAWGTTAEQLLACGQALVAIAPERIVVKLPLTEPGLKAAGALVGAGTQVTLTACYGVPQVLAAAAQGVAYVAPYLGRISDAGFDGCAEVLRMQSCLSGLKSPTRLLVASLRSPEELTRLAAAGIDTFTLPPALAGDFWKHSASEAAAAQFERDAQSGLPAP
ncbi:MAG: transaldolase family protein [Cyanobium sp.]